MPRKLIGKITIGIVLLLSTTSAAATPLPWEGGSNVETEAERVFGEVASHLAGRPVSVRCNGEFDWALLVNRPGFDPTWLGFVHFDGNVPWDYTELHPGICAALSDYLYAELKPPYWCEIEIGVNWKYVPVPVKKGQQKRVRLVRIPIMETAPCRDRFFLAFFILAHESVHLSGIRDEALADSGGWQNAELVSKMLTEVRPYIQVPSQQKHEPEGAAHQPPPRP